MAGVTDRQLRTAEARGRSTLATEPRAAAARYEPLTRRVEIDLVNGCLYAFPTQLVQDLQGTRVDDLARIEVDGARFNLHWPTLDVDQYIPALVAGIFGTREWMARQRERIAAPPAAAPTAASASVGAPRGGRPRRVARA